MLLLREISLTAVDQTEARGGRGPAPPAQLRHGAARRGGVRTHGARAAAPSAGGQHQPGQRGERNPSGCGEEVGKNSHKILNCE